MRFRYGQHVFLDERDCNFVKGYTFTVQFFRY
jgi:hypothetical protein